MKRALNAVDYYTIASLSLVVLAVILYIVINYVTLPPIKVPAVAGNVTLSNPVEPLLNYFRHLDTVSKIILGSFAMLLGGVGGAGLWMYFARRSGKK
jgi:phosphotransferase system  glucose/maltose/N-acetylglucosamine-specific IIC component